MTDAFAGKRLGGSNERRIESYRPRVAEINAVEKEHEALSDAALRARSEEFKKRLAERKPPDYTLGTRRNEQHSPIPTRRSPDLFKSASLAARPPAKGSEG